MANDPSDQDISMPTVDFVLVKSPSKTKIFISHSSADETLASALVDLLLSSILLEDSDIRCTSVPGHKLPVGSDFASTLRDDIGESSVVIGLITPRALTSSWVLFELGATWGADKNLKPLITSNVLLSSLPGPISGRHAARLSDRADIAQFLEEIAVLIVAKTRNAAKTNKAIDTFVAEHQRYISSQSQPSTKTKSESVKEPTFAGLTFSELENLLRKETLVVPARHTGGKGDLKHSLLDFFVINAKNLASGIRSDADRESAAGFLYQELAVPLLQYNLTQFDKLPASQAKWFQRISISPDGNKFLLHRKRVRSSAK